MLHLLVHARQSLVANGMHVDVQYSLVVRDRARFAGILVDQIDYGGVVANRNEITQCDILVDQELERWQESGLKIPLLK